MAARPRIVRAIEDRDDPGDALADPGFANTGFADPGVANPGVANPGFANTGFGDPASANPASANPGAADRGFADRGFADAGVDVGFDEAAYLRAFPDIAEAVRRRTLESGLAHYRLAGRVEGRLDKPEYRAQLLAENTAPTPTVSVDTLTISESGATMLTGWSDDRRDTLTEVNLETRPDATHNWVAFPRLSRADVQRTLDTSARHKFGFLLVAAPVGGADARKIDPRAVNAPVFRFASGRETRLHRDPSVASDVDLRDLALAVLPTAAADEPDPEAIYNILDRHVGVQIAAINRLVVDRERTRRFVSRTGPGRTSFRGSIVTVARGDAATIVPRLALAAGGAGARDYEFIVVVHNAGQFEAASRAARVAHATLGLSLTMVLQPGGDPAGFGEDAAADIARSDRLIFMDRNIVPRDPDWTVQHTALLDAAPMRQTRLFGGVLFSPDGTVSHRGYGFERARSLLTGPADLPFEWETIRLRRLTSPASRALPAPAQTMGVPGAFMSVDRRWFETLGGFTRHYARATFDDIDFCLRSRQQGFPAWVHPLPMWHFERRGPQRPEPSKGGAILNDWLFRRQWHDSIRASLADANPGEAV